jgi:hypothetical protein
MDLLQQAVRNMLTALNMPDISDNELDDLILYVGHTGTVANEIGFPLTYCESFSPAR